MQFESHATPYGGTPQHRYATLHRALEKGLESDEILVELANVCASLGHRGEAVRSMQRVRCPHARARVEAALKRHFGAAAREGAPQRGPAAVGKPAAPSPAPRAVAPQGPSAAPAASHAGTDARADAGRQDAPGVADHLLDAVQYLLHQHMPWLVLTTTLAFPVLVGVGGFLTAGGSLLLLAAIAALPGVSVLAVVAAMGRRILLSSANGDGDVPTLPEFADLVKDARRFAGDALLILATFFSLPITLAVAGAPFPIVAATLIAGGFFAPLGFALRQLRGDMRALAPQTLLRAVQRCGPGYIAISMVATLSFAPAGAVTMLTMGSPVWVQIALVGPLCVLPVFSASRLIGSWIDTRRAQLGYLIKNREQTMLGDGVSPVDAPQAVQAQPRMPKKPARLENFKPPVVENRTAPYAGATGAARPQRPAKPAPRRPRAIEGRSPASKAAAAQRAKPAAPARPAPRPAPAAVGEGGPDLANLPGAVVVSGEERLRQGAASRRP